VEIKPRLKLAARLANPLARAGDALLLNIPNSPFRRPVSRLEAEPLTADLLIGCVSRIRIGLRPDYDRESLTWLFDRADQRTKAGAGTPQKVCLKTRSGGLAGWYIYLLNPGDLCVAVQIFSNPGYTREVVEHLFHHAFERGGVSVSGRADPHLLPELAQNFKLFWRQPCWMLVHSKRPEIVDTFHRGDAFFSRFDGEWSCYFI
jgi:hypothetical protein